MTASVFIQSKHNLDEIREGIWDLYWALVSSFNSMGLDSFVFSWGAIVYIALVVAIILIVIRLIRAVFRRT